jgi:FAD synthase
LTPKDKKGGKTATTSPKKATVTPKEPVEKELIQPAEMPDAFTESPKSATKLKKSNLIPVTISRFSKRYKSLARDQFDKKQVLKLGNVSLGERVFDGKEFEPGVVYMLPLTPALEEVLQDGVLLCVKHSVYRRAKA